MDTGRYLKVRPASKLEGTVKLAGDKSLSHRALLLASLAEGDSTIENCLHAGVTEAMMECLRDLGVELDVAAPLPGDAKGSATVCIRGRGMRGFKEPERPLDCRGSATTMRLMAGILSGLPFQSTLTGNDRLRERPMDRIVEPLRVKGAEIRTSDGNAPLSFFPSQLKPSSHVLRVASAQVKSALLFAGLFSDGPTTVSEPHASRDHTERMMRKLGVHLDEWSDQDGRHAVRIREGVHRLPPMKVRLPSDPSSAAFIIVSGLIVPESDITIPDVCVNPGRTGLLSVLEAMGAEIRLRREPGANGDEPVASIKVGSGPLLNVTVEGHRVPAMIDEFPIFAVAATQAKGTTTVKDAAELRLKESDRIQAVTEELTKLGANIEPRDDGFTVHGPTRLKGAVVDGRGDHRLAMSLAVAGLAAEGETVIEGWEVMNESFPEFPLVLRRLGAEVSW
ncbi:MAG: 3-phosphoshikimate 1-carboxyvinyltransferase [Pseudomonadota bacterium]